MIYREYEIEAFEIGQGQWHARYRRADDAATIIDGIEFPIIDVGFAWSTHEAALLDARHAIDRMRLRAPS